MPSAELPWYTGPNVVEVNKKHEGSDKESSDGDSQEDDDVEKYNPGELIGDISDDGDLIRLFIFFVNFNHF
jgi:hypothetical protein